MAEQAVVKSVIESIISGVRSHLFRTISGGAEERLASPPVSGDFKGGTSVVIPATQVIAAGVTAQISSCTFTDDEGNIFADAYDIVEWTTSDAAKGTVDKSGRVTKIGASDVIITATCLTKTDTCTVSVT